MPLFRIPPYLNRHACALLFIIPPKNRPPTSRLNSPHLGCTCTQFIQAVAGGEDWVEAFDSLAGGPNLVTSGKVNVTGECEGFDSAFVNNQHPRTAMGIKQDGTLLLLTVDGRTERATGMSLAALAEYLVSLGAIHAINLDGGGSTTAYVRGEGVVNFPSDNGVSDAGGERPVSTVLGLYAKSRYSL